MTGVLSRSECDRGLVDGVEGLDGGANCIVLHQRRRLPQSPLRRHVDGSGREHVRRGGLNRIRQMDLTHRFVLPAPIDVAWVAFNDLERIGRCFPGATHLSVEGDDFAGSVRVRLGRKAADFRFSGSFVERDETRRRSVIRASGRGQRIGTASVTVVAHMKPEGGATAVELTSDVSITGKASRAGRGFVQEVSDRLLGEFVECMAAELGARKAGALAVTGQLDLVSTVLPVMLRRYGLPAAGIVVLAVIIWFVAR